MISNFEDLFTEDSIEDIVLAPKRVLYFQRGRWQAWDRDIPETLNVFALARSIAESVDIELGYTYPSADAYWRLSDQHHFRAHIVCPPMIESGPEITLRRLRHTQTYSLEAFSCSPEQRHLLERAVLDRKNILICGPTGAGKSSLLCSLMSFIPLHERLLILEDSPELPLSHPFASRLLARSDRFGSRQGSQWQMTDLVVEALRMRPTRLLLGECRGREALALCRALQTGHAGVMTTVHAGSPQEAMDRVADLCRDQSESVFCQQQLWDLVISLKFLHNGHRILGSIHEKRI